MRKGLADDEKELYDKYKNAPPPGEVEEPNAGPVVHRLKNRAPVADQLGGRGGDRRSDSGSRKRCVADRLITEVMACFSVHWVYSRYIYRN